MVGGGSISRRALPMDLCADGWRACQMLYIEGCNLNVVAAPAANNTSAVGTITVTKVRGLRGVCYRYVNPRGS